MQVSSPIPDIGAVGVADLVGLTPQQPDPLEDLYAAAASYVGSGPVRPVAELVGIVAAMRAAARAERLDDGDGRHHTARLSVARAPQFPADGQMCAVLAVDIVGFTRADRDDDIRRYLHERLYAYLQQAFDRSGAPWAECFCEDRGDGALIVMPPEIPLKGLIDCFPDKLRGLVRLHNHVSAVTADMQLRVAAHIGPVEHDGYGFVGTDVNFAFRMLDARPLKNQLAKSGAELGLIVSDYVYNSLICRYPVLADPGAFQTVRFQTKNTRTRAWTYLPGAAA
jgi:class 3 adenylate cyclase